MKGRWTIRRRRRSAKLIEIPFGKKSKGAIDFTLHSMVADGERVTLSQRPKPFP